MMATKIYDVGSVELINGTKIELKPLKIKFLREFMEKFEGLKSAESDVESISILSDCAFTCMQQFCPEITTTEEFEDNVDLPTIYKILDYAAGIKVNEDKKESVKKQAESSEGATWDTLDLVKLESEVFVLGIWKNYEEMETSISMPELLATLGSKRELDHQERKFLAAIQGVDIDEGNEKKDDPWEAMKARVFSGGATSDPDDVLALQGITAQQAGFGIGMGLDYEKL